MEREQREKECLPIRQDRREGMLNEYKESHLSVYPQSEDAVKSAEIRDEVVVKCRLVWQDRGSECLLKSL